MEQLRTENEQLKMELKKYKELFLNIKSQLSIFQDNSFLGPFKFETLEERPVKIQKTTMYPFTDTVEPGSINDTSRGMWGLGSPTMCKYYPKFDPELAKTQTSIFSTNV